MRWLLSISSLALLLGAAACPGFSAEGEYGCSSAADCEGVAGRPFCDPARKLCVDTLDPVDSGTPDGGGSDGGEPDGGQPDGGEPDGGGSDGGTSTPTCEYAAATCGANEYACAREIDGCCPWAAEQILEGVTAFSSGRLLHEPLHGSSGLVLLHREHQPSQGDGLWLRRHDGSGWVDSGKIHSDAVFAADFAIDARGDAWVIQALSGGVTNLLQVDTSNGNILDTKSIETSAGTEGISVAIDESGNPYVAWVPDNGLQVLGSSGVLIVDNVIGSASANSTIERVAHAFDSQGELHLAWLELGPGGYTVQIQKGAGSPEGLVAGFSGADPATHPREIVLAIDPLDRPVLVIPEYTTTGSLSKVVLYREGSVGFIRTVLDSGSYNTTPSTDMAEPTLALDADGNAHVAWIFGRDTSAASIRYAIVNQQGGFIGPYEYPETAAFGIEGLGLTVVDGCDPVLVYQKDEGSALWLLR
ncbi:MAG: hypothetical protein P1V51_11370 [Deltaproteobacteria bacterium]|nr:hypothetical protein [Deltaproteobacteria bacterium]